MSHSQMQVSFAGHSTTLVELDGVRVLSDPLFRSSLLHLQRHAPLVDLDRYGSPDILLISHSHMDHLDKRSLKLVDKSTRAIVPSDSAKLMRGLGFRDVTGVSDGEEIEACGLRVRAVHADHHGSRMPWNAEAETIGFVVSGSQSFYYAGDTDLYDEMAGLGPGIDLALIPVWGWGPKLGIGHLDPARAAQAVELIGPRVAVPVHWGGYLPAGMAKRRPDLLVDPPRQFQRFVEESPKTDARVEVIAPGEEISIEKPQAAE
ncbi:MAG: MBL fold metallo-hydrolase [Thermoleophilaceae bacterium]|nr:MBL fold metallo-hydrolase [Thermoleophilaceae bacterium]